VGDVGDVGGVEDVGDVGDVGRGTCGIGGMSEWIRTIRVSMRRRVKKTERDIWNKNEYLEWNKSPKVVGMILQKAG